MASGPCLVSASQISSQKIRKNTHTPNTLNSAKSEAEALDEYTAPLEIPMGPCTKLLYTWAPKSLYRKYFKAQVFPI